MPPRAFVGESSEGIKQLSPTAATSFVRRGKGGRAVASAFTILYYKQGRHGLGGLTWNAAMVQRSCLSKNYDGGPDKKGKSRERPAASKAR